MKRIGFGLGALLMAVLLVAACGGDDKGAGGSGGGGNGPEKHAASCDASNCTLGGFCVQTGYDDERNDTLEAACGGTFAEGACTLTNGVPGGCKRLKGSAASDGCTITWAKDGADETTARTGCETGGGTWIPNP